MPILLDLNNPAFQDDWFSIGKDEQLAVLSSCRKLRQMDWDMVHRDKGFHWEAIQSRKGRDNTKLYTIRMSRKMRAVVKRSGDYLEFLALHPDHDSAYE